jgi:hypothetical protein
MGGALVSAAAFGGVLPPGIRAWLPQGPDWAPTALTVL